MITLHKKDGDEYEIRRDSALLGRIDSSPGPLEDSRYHIYFNNAEDPGNSHSIGSFQSPINREICTLRYAHAYATGLLKPGEEFKDLTLARKSEGKLAQKVQTQKHKIPDTPDTPGGRPGGAATLHFG